MNNPSTELINIASYATGRGWCPATGGNFSTRLAQDKVAITASGADKGNLTAEDILTVDLNGNVLNSTRKPSDETLLHLAMYKLDPEINAVLHVHTVANTVLSRYVKQSMLSLQDYEMLKPFRGVTTHQTTIEIPILDNSQDMTVLATQISSQYSSLKNCYGFLVRGHGCYVWGNSIVDAKRHLETLEFLLTCELELLKLTK
ncbi:MAG: methylthioribulose 1-phosphate dehydratase [Gammaproteobacteria bacterium]